MGNESGRERVYLVRVVISYSWESRGREGK